MKKLAVEDEFNALRENMCKPLSESEKVEIIKNLIKLDFEAPELSERLGMSEDTIKDLLSRDKG
ncbi:hypothetical protein I7093_004469 [Vibrio parahaemolyticus]|nr:hypothetical protein [Vibrio parahaemolyticus]